MITGQLYFRDSGSHEKKTGKRLVMVVGIIGMTDAEAETIGSEVQIPLGGLISGDTMNLNVLLSYKIRAQQLFHSIGENHLGHDLSSLLTMPIWRV